MTTRVRSSIFISNTGISFLGIEVKQTVCTFLFKNSVQKNLVF